MVLVVRNQKKFGLKTFESSPSDSDIEILASLLHVT
jgi:hypothetical protein